jgi:hypothetical protein
MSSMLEQAIVDAEALKEAALQSAEQAVIEKYQSEIKGAVEALLEQDEEEPFLDDEDGEFDLGGEEEGMESSEELAQQIPLASTEGEKLCACPDEDEELEVDFDQLKQQMTASEEGPALAGDMNMDLGPLEEEKTTEEEFNLTEEELVGIIEELTLDMEPTKSGWLQRPDSSVEHEIDILQTKVEEPLDVEEVDSEEEKDDSELSEAKVALTQAQKEIGSLEEKVDKYKEMLLQMKDTLSEVNLQNAKLLYTNQALVDASLNERQKEKFVEAIMKSNSVEETKTIFETLQSTVGASPSKKVAPKSLSEAVERRSVTLPRRVEKETSTFSDRMKTLAGINK